MKELQIEKIAYQWNNPHGIQVILCEKRKQRRLAMHIGQYEGQALLQALEKVKLRRPFTHDLLAATLETLGAEVERVVLTEFREENHTYYAAIIATLNGTTHSIDARPSDALALAVRTNAPIFAEEVLLRRELNGKPLTKAVADAKAVAAIPPPVTLWPREKSEPPTRSARPEKKSVRRS